MSQTRAVFKAGVSAAIYSNTQKLIKGDTVRDKFLVMADSVIFIEQANVAGGFLAIDSTTANVNIAFIKAIEPFGYFLRDDGTWASVPVLPSQSGNAGKVLSTNGSALSWVSVSAGGSDTSIQYNTGGAFTGSDRFVWNSANSYLKAEGSALFGLPVSNNPTSFLDVAAATTARASLRIRSSAGTTPSSPNEGEIWNNGSFLWIRIGGVNKKFTLTV